MLYYYLQNLSLITSLPLNPFPYLLLFIHVSSMMNNYFICPVPVPVQLDN